jgi:hypothetical protein
MAIQNYQFRRLGRAGQCVVLACLCACGGRSQQNDSSAAPSTLPSDVVTACQNEATSNCTKRDQCEAGYEAVVYGSLGNCIARYAQWCDRRAVAPGSMPSSVQLATCTTNQEAQTCDEWIGTLTPGCGFVGTKPTGEPCLSGSQCASGFCDEFLYATERDVCGVCASPRAEGDSCSSSCGGDGSVACEFDPSGVNRCVKLASAGASCDAVAGCATGLVCAIPLAATTGQCLPATGNDGDPCDDRAGPICDYRRRLYCNAQTHVCGLARALAPGEPCGRLADGSVGECASGVCQKAASNSAAGVCVAYIPDGAHCTFGIGTVPCAPPALCASGTCRIVGGELCE